MVSVGTALTALPPFFLDVTNQALVATIAMVGFSTHVTDVKAD